MAELHMWEEVNPGNNKDNDSKFAHQTMRMAVPGGWIYMVYSGFGTGPIWVPAPNPTLPGLKRQQP